MKKKETAKYYLAAFVAIATFAIYLSCLRNEFVVWDDDLYVYENLHIRILDAAFFRWAFFDFHAGNWHPLTWISHALDYAIWGLNPLGHHLTNILLHALNTFVVVVLGVRLLDVAVHDLRTSGKSGTLPNDLRKRPDFPISFLNERTLLIAAATTGMLFGLHPLHVESVAWVSERKDLLCALFFLLSIMMYARYAGRGGPLWTPKEGQPQRVALTQNDLGQSSGPQFFSRYYIFTLIFFILALLSKPMAVTLPLILLILDWYPFERIQTLKAFRSVCVEKVPFFALSLGSSVLTVFAQRAGGALTSVDVLSLPVRVAVAAKSLILYLWKMVLPLNLVPFYPYPKETSLLSIEYLAAIVLVAGITAACIIMARRQRIWLSAWGYYVIMLLPVLGIVQVGLQSMADRYTYLPGLGPFLLVGVMAAGGWERMSRLKRGSAIAKYLAVAAVAVVVISLSYLTFKQIGIWKNSIVFWSYVIKKEPEKVPVAYYNRGIAFDNMGLPDKAIADYDMAIALKPAYYEAYNNRGLAFEKTGLLDKAIKDLEAAMSMKPSSPEAYSNLGKIYRKTGQFDMAIENYDRAIALKPSYYEAYYNRAIVYEKMGQLEAALGNYNKAIALNPAYYEAYNNLGVLYGNASAHEKAIEYFTKAILLNQSRSGAYINRGVLYDRTGNRGLAIADFQKACDLGNKAGCSARNALEK